MVGDPPHRRRHVADDRLDVEPGHVDRGRRRRGRANRHVVQADDLSDVHRGQVDGRGHHLHAVAQRDGDLGAVQRERPGHPPRVVTRPGRVAHRRPVRRDESGGGVQRQGAAVGGSGDHVLLPELLPSEECGRAVWLVAERDGDAANLQVQHGLAAQRRSDQVDRGAERHVHVDRHADEEADPKPEPCGDRDADADVVVKRVPLDEEVRVRHERRVDARLVVGDLEASAGHHAAAGQREVRLALDDDRVADRPVEAETRHDRELERFHERGVVAAECEHELVPEEPHEEGEASGELAVAAQQPRVVGELRLHRQHALRGREPGLERQLDRGELERAGPGVGRGNGGPGDAHQADLDAAVQRGVHHGDRADEGERGEPNACRQPEAAPLREHRVAQPRQRAHRVVADAVVDGGDQRESLDVDDLDRGHEVAVVAGAGAQPGDEQVRRAAEWRRQAGEHEQRGEPALLVGRPRVRAHGGEGPAGGLHGERPGVVERRPGALDQATGHRHRAVLQSHGQAAQVEGPRPGLVELVERDLQTQLVCLDGERADLHAAIDEDFRSSRVPAAGRRRHVREPDLVDGQRPEAAVQADPQWTRRERDPGVVLSPEQDEIATRAPGGDQ